MSSGAPAPDPQRVRGAAALLDDETLVVRARDGDLRAFEDLVRRFETPLYRLALRMLDDRGEAEDVVQETFLSAWRRLPELRDARAFTGWLYRVTTNRCLNLLRARRPAADVDLDLLESAAGSRPERVVETATALDALGAALRRLTPPQRAAWLLREVHGLAYGEIAHIMGSSPAAVRGRIARARVDLAEAMQSWR